MPDEPPPQPEPGDLPEPKTQIPASIMALFSWADSPLRIDRAMETLLNSLHEESILCRKALQARYAPHRIYKTVVEPVSHHPPLVWCCYMVASRGTYAVGSSPAEACANFDKMWNGENAASPDTAP